MIVSTWYGWGGMGRVELKTPPPLVLPSKLTFPFAQKRHSDIWSTAQESSHAIKKFLRMCTQEVESWKLWIVLAHSLIFVASNE